MNRCPPPLATAPHRPTGQRRQAGSIVINAAIALSLIVIALVGTELGYLFYMKRELQKTADLAAIAGASSVEATDCNAARSAALTNAAQNLSGFTPQVTCGRWDAAQGTERNFVAGQTDHNAVQVVITGTPPPLLAFFPGQRQLQAEAIAAVGDPLASFSVGSTLLNTTSPSVLGALLKGIGLDLAGTSLVGYNGLAQVQITPAGLLQALNIEVATDVGVGELDALLAAENVQLGEVLNAIVTLAGQEELLGANAALLNAVALRLGIDDLNVRLGSLANGPRGLFAAIAGSGASANSALSTTVSALDLLYASVGVATQKHALEVNDLSLAGLVSAKTVLIEPPSVGIGGVGATAYTAQLRTWVDIDTSNVPLISNLPLLSGMVRVKLPIMIDLVNGRGTITEMCTPELRRADGTDQATIAVNASIAKVCIGRPGANPANEDEIFSTVTSCEQQLAPDNLLRVSLLGSNLVSLTKSLHIEALPLADSVTLAAGETGSVDNQLQLGTTVQNLTNALLATLLVETLDNGPAVPLSQRRDLAEDLWQAEGPACTTRDCRINRLNEIASDIEGATEGLGGFLGTLTGDVLALLGNTLSLDVLGLLGNVGDLVGGLLATVGDVLGGVLAVVTGHPCTGGGLFNAPGEDSACVNEIASTLAGNSGSGSNAVPNAITALAGFLLQTLRPVLDSIGSAVLTPLLQNVLGLNLGQIDVNLQTLSCQARARLVY